MKNHWGQVVPEQKGLPDFVSSVLVTNGEQVHENLVEVPQGEVNAHHSH